MSATRYVARFVPQAWVNDYAITVDSEGENEWDCTDYLDPAYFTKMCEMRPYFTDETLDNDDVLKCDPAAPEWVREWRGPFDIWIRQEGDDDE